MSQASQQLTWLVRYTLSTYSNYRALEIAKSLRIGTRAPVGLSTPPIEYISYIATFLFFYDSVRVCEAENNGIKQTAVGQQLLQFYIQYMICILHII